MSSSTMSALANFRKRSLCHKKVLSRQFSRSTSACSEDLRQNSSGLPQPRLDYRSITENAQFKSHNAFNRKAPVSVGAVQTITRLYEEYKSTGRILTQKMYERSTIGKQIRGSAGEEKGKLKELAKSLKGEISSLFPQLGKIEERLQALALSLPNDTHPDTPIGPESAAVTVATHGPEPIPATPERDHLHVGRALGFLDLDAASAVTGSSWYYLLNEGALLEMALVQYALSKAIARGFTPVITPDVVKSDVAWRCGFQPRDHGDPPTHHMYHLHTTRSWHPELVLSGTAEIPLAGLLANKVYLERDLPLKLVGFGRSFRSEAGSRGTDTRGLYRVHQFTKLELFVACPQEKSEEIFKELIDLQVEIFSGLGLSLRVLDMPTEELGASAYRKFDIEAWMPGRGRWGEISSTSNCTDFQARRLHIRYRRNSEESEESSLSFAHTLNGTAAAIPRLIVALIENGVQLGEKGEVLGLNLPSVLRSFFHNLPGTNTRITWI